MGKCSTRHFVLTICTLQLIVVVECQVFDFLGFMYGPILVNFFHVIFIILGFFGAFQYSTKYIISYSLWNLFWVSWTIFLICFYLDLGMLNKNSDILNLGTGSRSWWEVNGYGCLADFTSVANGSSLEQDPDPSRPPKPVKVEGCLIEYQYVEVIQASVQCLLGVLAVISGTCMSKIYLEEDDSLLFFWNNSKSLRQVELQPIYVTANLKNRKLPTFEKNRVTFFRKKENRSKKNSANVSNSSALTKEPQGSSLNYTYQTSRRHLDQYQQRIRSNGFGPRSVSPRPMTPRRVKRRSILARDTMNRSSLTQRRQGSSRSRSSQRRTRALQNPVTRLLEQQNGFLESSVASASFNDSSVINSSILPTREESKDFDTTNGFTTGLNNPVFQQSSNSSINQSGVDEMYRPNSARSSYSNYHASRPVSYLHNNEYFSNQAVAQVPISTNRSKGLPRQKETQNNLHSTKSTATLKSFSQKNFNFLGFNVKNSNVNTNFNYNNNNNNNNSSNNNNYNNTSSNNNNNSNSNIYNNDNVNSNSYIANFNPARNDGTIRNSKRFRADLTRRSGRTSNSFFSQGPPAYREGGLDSETVI